MRRGKIATLKKKNIYGEFLIVRGGKGGKDRTIPLLKNLAIKLNNFIKDLVPEERVFGPFPRLHQIYTSSGIKPEPVLF